MSNGAYLLLNEHTGFQPKKPFMSLSLRKALAKIHQIYLDNVKNMLFWAPSDVFSFPFIFSFILVLSQYILGAKSFAEVKQVQAQQDIRYCRPNLCWNKMHLIYSKNSAIGAWYLDTKWRHISSGYPHIYCFLSTCITFAFLLKLTPQYSYKSINCLE